MKEDMEAETNPQLQKSKKKKKRKIIKQDVEIEMLKEHPDKNAPFLGYYPSGFDPINPQLNNPPALKFYRNHKKPRRVELVVSPSGSKVDYVGTNYSGEAAAGRMCNHALGVLDKASQTLKIVPITANKIFRLQPWVGASHISDKEPVTPAKSELTTEERIEKLNSLTSLYGTKEALKKAKKARQLSQKEDPSSQQELRQILEETPIDKAALASTSTDTSANNNIPPHDLSATTPEGAYLLEKIILKGEWDYVLDVLVSLQAGQDIKPDVYPSFVCNRVYKLELIKDEAEKRKLGGILSYITHLINFKDRHSLDGVSSAKHQKFLPSILLQRFNKMFVDSEKNRLSDEKIGTLISYVLVLTLFVDEFQSDFTDIAKDLKMPAVSLRPYFENLGCQFKRRNNVTVATLPVPLKFPTLRKRRRRG